MCVQLTGIDLHMHLIYGCHLWLCLNAVSKLYPLHVGTYEVPSLLWSLPSLNFRLTLACYRTSRFLQLNFYNLLPPILTSPSFV